MPQTDSLAYVHGTGTQVGNVTSTANVVGSGSQSGTTLTITTVTSGQFGVGQIVSGTGVLANTYITALGSGSGTAGTYVVSTSTTIAPTAVFTMTPPTLGDAFGTATGYTNLELDFGAPNSGGAYPYLPEFPSLTEKTYTFPPEIVGQGGTDWGLHILVTGYVNNLTSINFGGGHSLHHRCSDRRHEQPDCSAHADAGAVAGCRGALLCAAVGRRGAGVPARIHGAHRDCRHCRDCRHVVWTESWRRTVMPIVEALCLNDAFDSATCWYYTKGQMYTIDTDSEIARMTVRPMSSGKMNKDGEIVPAKLLRPPLPVFQFDHAVPLTVSGKPNDYTCKKCGATKDPLGRPFTLNTLGTHANSVHREA